MADSGRWRLMLGESSQTSGNMAGSKRVLFVLTSNASMGANGKPTGFWLEEFAAPYYKFVDNGWTVTVVSPAGGAAPCDPSSMSANDEASSRYKEDSAAMAVVANTGTISSVDPADFDALFYPGGHGPMWDLVSHDGSIKLIESFVAADKPLAAVCHGPCVLVKAKTAGGESILQGKACTGFSNAEEEAAGLTSVVPFSLEDAMKECGGKYVAHPDGLWKAHVQVDGKLVTGQNPASSEATADAVLAICA